MVPNPAAKRFTKSIPGAAQAASSRPMYVKAWVISVLLFFIGGFLILLLPFVSIPGKVKADLQRALQQAQEELE